jgi:hypothetical protein
MKAIELEVERVESAQPGTITLEIEANWKSGSRRASRRACWVTREPPATRADLSIIHRS